MSVPGSPPPVADAPGSPTPVAPGSPPSLWRRRLLALALLGMIGASAYPTVRYLRAEHHLRRAAQALEAGSLDEAGMHLAECLEVWPDSGRAHLLAAQAARRSDLYEEAAEHLEASRKALGPCREIELERALLDFQRGRMSPFLEAYLHDTLRHDPPEGELILEAMAQGYMRCYCLKPALSCLDEWLRRRPDASAALLRRGWVHERLDRFEAAEQDYRAVLANHPEHPAALLRLGQVLLLSHRGKDAAPYFRTLLKQEPANRAARVGLASSLAERGEMQEAQAILDAVLAEHPRDADALRECGKLALEQGHIETAEGWLREAARLLPHDYPTQFQLLQCLERAGSKDEALAQDRRVKALAADLEEMRRLTDALLSLPNDPDLRCRIGQLFLRRGEEREGLLWLEEVLQTHPDHAPTRQALAEHRARKK
jgi:predicted Zn-dependent protease